MNPEDYAQMIQENKPYLIELENKAQQLDYGTIELRMTVRAGVVVRMDFKSEQTWMKDKT